MPDVQRFYGRKPSTRAVRNSKPFRAGFFTKLQGMVTRSYSYEYAMPPVWDQAQYGSCVAHGTAGLFEFFHRKRLGDTTPVSRRAIYSQAKHSYEPTDIADDGLEVVDGLNVGEYFGYVPEAALPYPADGQPDVMLAPVPPELWVNAFRFSHYVSVPYDIASMRLALLKHGPMVAGNSWPAEWEYPGNDGRLDPSPVTAAGGHCWMVIAFNDDFVNLDGSRGAFRIRNSWGAWADRGNAWMPFSAFMKIGWPEELWTVNV